MKLFLTAPPSQWPKQVSMKSFREVLRKVMKVDSEAGKLEKTIARKSIELSKYKQMLQRINDRIVSAEE